MKAQMRGLRTSGYVRADGFRSGNSLYAARGRVRGGRVALEPSETPRPGRRATDAAGCTEASLLGHERQPAEPRLQRATGAEQAV